MMVHLCIIVSVISLVLPLWEPSLLVSFSQHCWSCPFQVQQFLNDWVIIVLFKLSVLLESQLLIAMVHCCIPHGASSSAPLFGPQTFVFAWSGWARLVQMISVEEWPLAIVAGSNVHVCHRGTGERRTELREADVDVSIRCCQALVWDNPIVCHQSKEKGEPDEFTCSMDVNRQAGYSDQPNCSA